VVAVRTRRPLPACLTLFAAVAVIAPWAAKASAASDRFVLVNTANPRNFFYGNNPWTPLYRTWWFGSHKRGEPDVPDQFVDAQMEIERLAGGERDRAFARVAR